MAECPTCQQEFDNELGVKQHHSRTHGVSLTTVRTECANCGEELTVDQYRYEQYDSIYCDETCRTDGLWRDKEWMYEKYWREGMNGHEVAEQADTWPSTIHTWLQNHGIPRRHSGEHVDSFLFRHKDREWLFNEYWVEGKTTGQIADENNVDRVTVARALDDADPPIKRRTDLTGYNHPDSVKHATRGPAGNGYVGFNVGIGKEKRLQVREHRVTAIGEWGLDAVKGKEVHHANGIKWLNVPEFDIDIPELENPNLVPVDPITHKRIEP